MSVLHCPQSTTNMDPWLSSVLCLHCTILANDILKQALQPGVHGIPHMVSRHAVAVVLITVAQAGLIVAGYVGTGILLRKRDDGTWSRPSACGLTGFGCGMLAGASLKDLIVFINSQEGLDALMSVQGLELGGEAEVTLGHYGRSAGLDINVGHQSIAMTYTLAYSKGAFVGLSVQGAVIGARNAINMYFYGKEVSPEQILLDEDAVDFPIKWMGLMDEVYAKLMALTCDF